MLLKAFLLTKTPAWYDNRGPIDSYHVVEPFICLRAADKLWQVWSQTATLEIHTTPVKGAIRARFFMMHGGMFASVSKRVFTMLKDYGTSKTQERLCCVPVFDQLFQALELLGVVGKYIYLRMRPC